MRGGLRLLALAGVLLAGCGGGRPRPAPAPRTPAEAIRRGADFLLAAQNRDGSWGSCDPCHVNEIYLGTVAAHDAFGQATSALCAMALMQLPEGDPRVRQALDRGLSHLAGQEPALRQTGDALYNVWGNLYALQCLARASADPRWPARHGTFQAAARRQLESLERFQSALGGWGYYDFTYATRRPSGEHATSFTTAAALVALDGARHAGMDVPETMTKAAVGFLASLRNGNGAYLYGDGHRFHPNSTACKIKGSLGRSQSGEYALSLFGKAGPSDTTRALENFFTYHHFLDIGRQRQFPHEAWYATAGYYYFFGHYYAACNIAALPGTERARFAPRLIAILTGTQEPDGSWWDFPMYGYSKAYGTGLALLALTAIHPPEPADQRLPRK